MNRLRTSLILLAALALLAGCAAAPPAAEPPPAAARPLPLEQPPVPPPPALPDDENLFAEGVRLLNLPDRPEPAVARAVFVSLCDRYPRSAWRPASETFIRLIDEIAALRRESQGDRLMAEQVRTERTGAMRENEALKQKLQELTERLQKETAALALENERLKRDLGRLKALEVELEKRERMLR